VTPTASDNGEVRELLSALEQDLRETIGLEQRHAAIIEKLHAENLTLRQGELVQSMKPLLLDIARLHDDVARVIERGGEDVKGAAIIPALILDVLDRHGVTQIDPEIGSPFDAKVHQAVQVVRTADAQLDGTIFAVRRPGFLRDGAHLVRPAQVEVHKLAPATPAENNLTTNEVRSENVA
jgi:molecular chaperone GrpE (heat shock protein)